MTAIAERDACEQLVRQCMCVVVDVREKRKRMAARSKPTASLSLSLSSLNLALAPASPRARPNPDVGGISPVIKTSSRSYLIDIHVPFSCLPYHLLAS